MDERVLAILTIVVLMCFGTDANYDCKPKPMEECNPDACTTEKQPCPVCKFCKKDKDGTYKCHNFGQVKNSDDIKVLIGNFESCRLNVYDANPDKDINDPTVGYGFSLKQGDAQKNFEKVLPGVDFDKIKNGAIKLTKEQAWKLLCFNVDEKIKTAKRLIGDALYNKLPWNVKAALVNAFFRGDIGPKTIALIKKEEWEKVSKEYLDHDGYRDAEKNGMSGIKKRMDCNAWHFDSMVPGKHKCN